MGARRERDPELTERARLLGLRIQSLRIALGLSQREVADRAGLESSYISRLENGRHPSPSADVVGRIAAALGVDPDALLHRGSPDNPDVLRVKATPKHKALWSLVRWFRQQCDLLDGADDESVVFVQPRGGVVKRE